MTDSLFAKDVIDLGAGHTGIESENCFGLLVLLFYYIYIYREREREREREKSFKTIINHRLGSTKLACTFCSSHK